MQNENSYEQLRSYYQLLLSKFSHEIRNPLTLVFSEMQLLSASHPELENCDEWDDIIENLEYSRDLLNEMSNFNNAGRIKLKETDLRDYLETVLECVRPSMTYLGIELESKFDDTLPTMQLDRLKLKQALLNLLRNAQEAISHDHGKILIQAHADRDNVILSIQDNGSGIDPEFLSKLFTPFSTTKSTGTGLGLSITKQIIEAHGGKIQVNSCPDHGTTFELVLPIGSYDADDTAEPPSQIHQ